MGFWGRLFGLKRNASPADKLVLLFSSLKSEKGGENLAVIFNNMSDAGGGNLGMFLGAASPQQIEQFANWIEAATQAELEKVATHVSRANAYELVNLMSWLHDLRQTRNSSDRRAERPPPVPDARKGPAVFAQPVAPHYSEVMRAVVSGDVPEVERLLRKGFDVNTRNEHGETLLLNAVCMGDARLAVARVLVAHGADVNATTNGRTLLKRIRDPVYCDNEQTIQFLLQHGAVEETGPAPKPEEPRVVVTPSTTTAESFSFPCPHCSKKLKAQPELIGRRAKCPGCNAALVVPRPNPPPSTVDEPHLIGPGDEWDEEKGRYDDEGEWHSREGDREHGRLEDAHSPIWPGIVMEGSRGQNGEREYASGSTGPCSFCGRRTAANVKPGDNVMPIYPRAWLNCQGFWCSRCRKVICGECCGTAKSVVDFKCPRCGEALRWAGPDDWGT